MWAATITEPSGNNENTELIAPIPDENIKVLFSSNIKINDLYKDGLQRDQFLPFIKVMKNKCYQQKLNIEEQIVYDIIFKNKELSANEIQIKSGIKTSILNALLINLEIKQYIKLKFGNFYEIKF